MIVFFIMMLLVYLAGNIYIYMRGLQAAQLFSLSIKWVLSICYWIVPFAFVFIFLFRNAHMHISLSRVLFEIGTGWLVFVLYMVLMLACFDLFRVFNKSFHHGFVLSLLFTICILAYGYIRYQHPVTKVINIVINKQTSTPESNFKIVAISDVHLGLGTVKSQLNKYVEMINKQEPDLILICGDLIDNSIVPVIDQQMQVELSRLQARYGVYMALGNHEYISGIEDCLQFFAQTPIHILRDSVVTLPNGVQLVGREDRSMRLRKGINALIQETDPSRPVIVLDHQPVEISRTVEAGADLLICGHTHYGQVWPLNWVTKKMFDISYGYEQWEQTHIYVSSGLSLWGPPFRIGTQSEMVVVHVEFS